jgi:hypothetical protein
MKRFTAILLGLAMAGSILGQGTFTIRRPVEGQTVRETVDIRIPRNSVPGGGYLGIWVNGKFLEATVPELSGGDYLYRLDTKARKIADGPAKIEVVLYVDFNDRPRVVNRSSVNVKVDNAASIRVGAEGLRLRYEFSPGMEKVYRVENRVSFATITDQQNRAGGRAAELPIEAERFRYLYAVDNVFRDGGQTTGMVRAQMLPLPGLDYVRVTTESSQQPRRYSRDQLAPLYMRLTDTGREIFGAVPLYVPMAGSSFSFSTLDLYALIPLPVLPSRPVRPGDSWQSPFQGSTLDISRVFETKRLTSSFPARGTLEGIEWEGGRRTARIRNSIEFGASSEEGRMLQTQGRAFADDKITLNELVWFDIDRGVVTKLERDITIDRKLDGAQAGGGAPGGTTGPNNGGGRPGEGNMGERRRGGPPGGQPDMFFQFQDDEGGQRGMGGARGGGGGFGRGQRRGAGQSQPQAQFVRIRTQTIMTLER